MKKGRPLPTVLNTVVEGDFQIEVLAVVGSYSIAYQGEPIALKRNLPNCRYQAAKYLRTNFPTPAHAWNQADRMNALTNSDDFTVVKMTGETVCHRPAV